MCVLQKHPTQTTLPTVLHRLFDQYRLIARKKANFYRLATLEEIHEGLFLLAFI